MAISILEPVRQRRSERLVAVKLQHGKACEQNSVSEFFELKLDKTASKVSLTPFVQRRPKGENFEKAYRPVKIGRPRTTSFFVQV